MMALLNKLGFPLNLLGLRLDQVVHYFSKHLNSDGVVYYFDKVGLSYNEQGLEFIFDKKMRVETIHVHVGKDSSKHKFIFIDNLRFFNSLKEIKKLLGAPFSIKEESALPILGPSSRTESYIFQNITVVLSYNLGSKDEINLITFCILTS